jgi:hypothetical protein
MKIVEWQVLEWQECPYFQNLKILQKFYFFNYYLIFSNVSQFETLLMEPKIKKNIYIPLVTFQI